MLQSKTPTLGLEALAIVLDMYIKLLSQEPSLRPKVRANARAHSSQPPRSSTSPRHCRLCLLWTRGGSTLVIVSA